MSAVVDYSPIPEEFPIPISETYYSVLSDVESPDINKEIFPIIAVESDTTGSGELQDFLVSSKDDLSVNSSIHKQMEPAGEQDKHELLLSQMNQHIEQQVEPLFQTQVEPLLQPDTNPALDEPSEELCLQSHVEQAAESLVCPADQSSIEPIKGVSSPGEAFFQLPVMLNVQPQVESQNQLDIDETVKSDSVVIEDLKVSITYYDTSTLDEELVNAEMTGINGEDLFDGHVRVDRTEEDDVSVIEGNVFEPNTAEVADSPLENLLLGSELKALMKNHVRPAGEDDEMIVTHGLEHLREISHPKPVLDIFLNPKTRVHKLIILVLIIGQM